MKKIILSVLFLAGLASEMQASNVIVYPVKHAFTQDKVSVRPEDLPEAVKNVLSSDAYSGWQVTSASRITRDDNSQYFEINARKDGETTVINLDKYGKKVD